MINNKTLNNEKKSMQEYPASHSMDTTWFAVDKEGNLGLFDSGEGGAVPKSNYQSQQISKIDCFDDFLLAIAENYQNHLIPVNLSGEKISKCLNLKQLQDSINLEAENKTLMNFTPFEERMLYDCLLVLSSDNVIPRLEIDNIKDNYGLLWVGEKPLIYIESCRVVILQKLIEDGLILAGKEWDSYGQNLVTLFGFFSYVQFSGGALPYYCTGKSIHSFSLGSLPANVKNMIIWHYFDDLSFKDRKIIQPIEHFPCHTWGLGQWWIDREGKEREGHPYE